MGVNPILKFCCAVLHALILVVVTPIVKHILSGTTVSLPYAVMYPCTTPFAELDADTTIKVPGLFGAELQPYTAKLSTEGKDPAGRVQKVALGQSLFPNMKLKPGSNPIDFTTGVGLSDTSALLNDFIVPMFMNNQTVKLFLDVDNISLTVFKFIKVTGLKMNKVLMCRGSNTTKPKDIPDKYCKPTVVDALQRGGDGSDDIGTLMEQTFSRRLAHDQEQGYQMVCQPDSGENLVV